MFNNESVFADAGIIKFSLFKRIDLINTGSDLDFDVPIRNGDMATTILLHLDTKAGSSIFNDGIADLYFCFQLAAFLAALRDYERLCVAGYDDLVFWQTA